MHQTSTGSNKNSSPGEHLKENKCAPSLKMRPPPCKCSWTGKDGYGSMDELTMHPPSSKHQAPSSKLQAPSSKLQGFLSNPQGFLAQNPHEVQTLSSSRWCALLLFLTSLKWRIYGEKYKRKIYNKKVKSFSLKKKEVVLKVHKLWVKEGV